MVPTQASMGIITGTLAGTKPTSETRSILTTMPRDRRILAPVPPANPKRSKPEMGATQADMHAASAALHARAAAGAPTPAVIVPATNPAAA